MGGEVLDSNRFLESVRGAIDAALWNSGTKDRGFAQGFARNCAGVDADPSDDFLPLNDADFFAELRRLHRSFLTGRSCADDE